MLTGKQRAFLRGLANKTDATIQVGKCGINDNMVRLVSDSLEKNELVKVHVLENAVADTRDVCFELAQRTGAEGVQIIGSKFVLYKQSSQNMRIDLRRLVVRPEKAQKANSVKPLYKAKETLRKERKRADEERRKKREFFAKRARSGYGR